MVKNQDEVFNILITLLNSTLPQKQISKKSCCDSLNPNAIPSLCTIIRQNIDSSSPLTNKRKFSIVKSSFESYIDSFSGNQATKREAFQEWLTNISIQLSQPTENLLPRKQRGSIKWENLAHTPQSTRDIEYSTGKSYTSVKNNFLTLPGLQKIKDSNLYFTPNRTQVFDELKFNSSEVGELFSCLSKAYTSSSHYFDKLCIEKIALDFYVQLTDYQKNIILPKFYSRKNGLEDFCSVLKTKAKTHIIKFISEEESYMQAKELQNKQTLLLTAIKQSTEKTKIDLIFKNESDDYISITNCKISYAENSSLDVPLYKVIYKTENNELTEIILKEIEIEDVIITFHNKNW